MPFLAARLPLSSPCGFDGTLPVRILRGRLAAITAVQSKAIRKKRDDIKQVGHRLLEYRAGFLFFKRLARFIDYTGEFYFCHP